VLILIINQKAKSQILKKKKKKRRKRIRRRKKGTTRVSIYLPFFHFSLVIPTSERTLRNSRAYDF